MREMKKSIAAFWVILLTLVLSLSYAPEVSAAKKASNVKSVTVTNLPSKKLTLKKGKTMTLKVKVESTNKKKVSQKVTFKTSNKKVATVSSKGKIKAVKKGKATITITSKANTKKNAKITVNVGTPVTSVSLNKTNATVLTGQSITLKATVKPKKPTNKGIVWSSSNSAIATVNSKGKVTTLKAGTVKITALAADGSGKKKAATITVKDPVVVKEAVVVNAATVKVTLSQASDLTAASFGVKSNKYGGSTYNKVNKVDNISTTDKTTYLVVLDSRSQLSDRDHVQVTVTGLWGTPSSVSTTIFNDGTFKYTDELTYTATVGERIGNDYDGDGYGYKFYGDGYGYMAFSVTNLPKGILYEEVGNYIRFYGKPQQAGNVVTQVVVADEAGNTYTYAITWVIGTKDSVTVTTSGEKYYLLDSTGVAKIGNEYSDYSDLQVTGHGGSGSYKYSLTGTTYDLTIDEYRGYIRGQLRGRGDYTLNVRVEDRENPAKAATTTVTIHVEQSVTVSGILKDLGGNPISTNNRIRFINKDKANKFGGTFYAYPDEKGAFSATLVSGTYDIVATCGAGNGETTSYLYSQQLTTTRSGFDITLAVRKINIYSNNTAVKASEFGNWEDAYGEVYGSGEYLYLKEGAYNLTTTVDRRDATITATVAANTASPTATASVMITPKNIPVVSVEVPVNNISLSSTYTYYKFTPATTGTYYFYSMNGTSEIEGVLENREGELLRHSYAGSLEISSYDFCYSYYCTAGETYFVGIEAEYSSSATATLNVSTKNPNIDELTDTEEQNTYNNPAIIDEVEEEATEETDVTPEEATDEVSEELTDTTLEVPEDVEETEPVDSEEADESEAEQTEAEQTEESAEEEEPAEADGNGAVEKPAEVDDNNTVEEPAAEDDNVELDENLAAEDAA